MFQNFKSSLFPVNGPLLKLKFTYFFVYAGTLKFELIWKKKNVNYPFWLISLVLCISVRCAYFNTNYRLHATSNYICLRTSYVNSWTCHHRFLLLTSLRLLNFYVRTFVYWTGFVADKIGNYKTILTATLLLNAVTYLSVLWLESDHRSYSTSRFNQTNSSANNSDLLVSTSSSVPQSSYTFPLLLVVRLLAFYTFDTTNFLLDSCSSTMCKKYGGDFGRQKMYSMASMIVFPIIVGVLIDEISAYRGR